ncbi:acyl-CoA dehydrogenase family protein [Amycolatopsis nivea]
MWRKNSAPASTPAASPVPLTLDAALAAVDRIAPVIAEEAPKTDRAAAFPDAGIAALREIRLLAAAAPRAHGGLGFTIAEQAEIAFRLGNSCGSTAMIWAMHQIQLACLAESIAGEPRLADYLSRAVREQHLIASVTSETGVGGDLRTSKAALRPAVNGFSLAKGAPTVSYGEHADSLLVTARRSEDAHPGDQVLVLVLAEQAQLRPTGVWDTLGMRGTCSGPHQLEAEIPAWQVLPRPFGEIATTRMVPVSHALWAAVWCGIADDAVRRAVRYSRVRLRGSSAAASPRLAWMHARRTAMTAAVREFARRYDTDPAAPGLAVQANAVKLQVSAEAVNVAQLALETCGMAGYSETGEFSVARHLRDLCSARLMISNDRLGEANAELLAFGDVY